MALIQGIDVMSRPPVVSAGGKIRTVLSVLAREMTTADTARRNKLSETSIGKRKQQFLCGRS
jgi:transposase